MLPHSSDKINEFIRQAASMHVLNTVYFIGLVVVALFTYTLVDDKANLSLFHSAAGYVLLVTFMFKVLIQNVSQLQKKLSESQVELVVTALNVMGTFLLLEPAMVTDASRSDFFLFLQSFLPTMLFILISPISWRKQHEYHGFFGFVQWTLIISVSLWAASIILELYYKGAWLSLISNLIVLASPLFLSIIRRTQMERLKVKIYEEIYQDPLTKIANRKCFYEHYDKVREINRRGNNEFDGFAVLFVDIDHFKLYNDYYGHEQGDECLKAVATFLNELAERLGLSCFRYGGEEFIVCGLKTITEWETILNSEPVLSWKNGNFPLPMKHERAPSGKVTLSGGAAFVLPSIIYECNAGKVTELADQYLYKSKNAGRARLTIAEPVSFV